MENTRHAHAHNTLTTYTWLAQNSTVQYAEAFITCASSSMCFLDNFFFYFLCCLLIKKKKKKKKLTAGKFFMVKFLSKLVTLGMIAMVSEIEDFENCDAHGCLFLLSDIM